MSTADELLKLKELLDSEILTQEEFDVQKNKLLNQDSNQVVETVESKINFNEEISSVRPPHSAGKEWAKQTVTFGDGRMSIKSIPEHSNDFELLENDILKFNYEAPRKGFNENYPENFSGTFVIYYKDRKNSSIETSNLYIFSEAEEKLLGPVNKYLTDLLKDKGMSCPKCDSTNVKVARGKVGMVALGVIFLPLAALAPKSKMKCSACGARWQNPF